VFGRDDEHGQRCLELLRILRGHSQSPPSPPSGSPPENPPHRAPEPGKEVGPS
jgi:hypothetical protein